MRVTQHHEVVFFMEEGEGPVMAGKHYGDYTRYARLRHVSVKTRSDSDSVVVYANGDRCKKDGGQSSKWGRQIITIELSEAERQYWIDWAATRV